MDLHGMHASTSYAQMPETFASMTKVKSVNKLDSQPDGVEKPSPNLLTPGTLHGSISSTGSLHAGHSDTDSLHVSNCPLHNLSNAGSKQSLTSLHSKDSSDKTEGESTPEHFGAKPKFTITTPEKKLDFDDTFIFTEKASVSKSPGELDNKNDIIKITNTNGLENDKIETVESNNATFRDNTVQPNKSPKLRLKRSKFKLCLPRLAELPALVRREICKKCAQWHDLGKGKSCPDDVASSDSKSTLLDVDDKTRKNSSDRSKNKGKCSIEEDISIKHTNIQRTKVPVIKILQINKDLNNVSESLKTGEKDSENHKIGTDVDHSNSIGEENVKIENTGQRTLSNSTGCPFGYTSDDDTSSSQIKTDVNDPWEYKRVDTQFRTGPDLLKPCPLFSVVRRDLCNGIDSNTTNYNSSTRLMSNIIEGRGTANQNGNSCGLESKSKSLTLRNGTVSHEDLNFFPQDKKSSIGSLYEIHDVTCSSRRGSHRSVRAVGDCTKPDDIVIFQISDDEERGQS